MEVFYDLAERLIEDEALTEADWDALFCAPGYREIDAIEKRRTTFPGQMELAYAPSNFAQRERHLAAEDSLGRLLLPNLFLAIDRQAEVEGVALHLARPQVLDSVLSRVSDYLPPGTTNTADPPHLFLIVLDGDSKALDAGIVLDAVGLAVMGSEYSELLIAHEFHHHYRQSLDRLDFDDLPEDILPLLRLMERAETEGIADLIDKQPLLDQRNDLPTSQTTHPLYAWMWEIYFEQYDKAAAHIAELEALLEAVARDESIHERARKLEQQASRLSARPLGVFVAENVQRILGRPRIAQCVGDPFELFLAYAEAAETTPTLPPLSARARQVLRSLQRRYAR